MPSFLGTPLTLTLTGRSPAFQPVLFGGSVLPLKISSRLVLVGPGAPNLTSDVTAPKLDRLQRLIKYFETNGTPTQKMVLDWQNTMEAIEAALRGLTGQLGDLSTLVAQIKAAQDLAQAAQTIAAETKAQQDITNSYTSPSAVLTASNDGTITIAAHQRVYGDGTSVSVDGGTLNGFSPGDYVAVYYDDPSRAGGPVVYMGTTDAVAQAGVRHSVGQIAIPQAGEAPSTGGGVAAPGYTPGGQTPRQYEEYV